MSGKLLAIVLMVWATISQGNSTFSTELKPTLSYVDLSTKCKTMGSYPLYLSVETDGDRLVRARLYAGGQEVFYRYIDFTTSELDSFFFEMDSFGRLWLSELRLNTRALLWVISNSGNALDGCTPSVALDKVAPTAQVFSFPMNGLRPGANQIQSQTHRFAGTRIDSESFQAKLSFTQER